MPDAIKRLTSDQHARPIGGGTNLLDLMKYGVEKPNHLIDINHLPLSTIESLPNGGLRIGALARNSDMADHPLIREKYPLLSEAILAGATVQLRNLATAGGNLLQRTRCYYFYDPGFSECNKRSPGSGCAAMNGINRIHAILGASEKCIAVHPSDMAVASAALGATVHVEGPKGARQLEMDDFYRLPGDTPQLDTNLHRDEIITAIELPPPVSGAKCSYVKVRDRNSYAFALVSTGALIATRDGKIQAVRIALGGVAHRPWRIQDVEQQLVGQEAGEAAYRKAAESIVRGAKPHTHNAFKVELAKRCIVRALTLAESRS